MLSAASDGVDRKHRQRRTSGLVFVTDRERHSIRHAAFESVAARFKKEQIALAVEGRGVAFATSAGSREMINSIINPRTIVRKLLRTAIVPEDITEHAFGGAHESTSTITECGRSI